MGFGEPAARMQKGSGDTRLRESMGLRGFRKGKAGCRRLQEGMETWNAKNQTPDPETSQIQERTRRILINDHTSPTPAMDHTPRPMSNILRKA